jgi:hypothetical protein
MGQLTHTTTEVDEQLDGVFAEIYTDDSSVTQTIATGTTPTKVTNFLTNGDSSHCTADQANNKITLTKTGEYKISITTSYTSTVTGGGDNWFGSIFVDGVELNDIHFERKITNGGDHGTSSATGFYECTSGPVDVDFRVQHDDGGSLDITKTYMNLNVFRVGV